MGDDPTSFQAFYVQERPVMLRVATLIVGDVHAAEDVVQEGFARAYSRWGRVSSYDKPGAWLRLVVARLAVRHRAARIQATEHVERREAIDDAVDAEPLLTAIRSLPRPERAVIVLHYLCDQPVAEVARVLRIKPGTARVQLHRARARLADALMEGAEDAR